MATEIRTAESQAAPGSRIVVKAGFCGGKPHIAGHRIKVQHIAVWHQRMGMSVDEIASTYDLTLAQVYSALAYYWDHKQQIDDDIQSDRDFVDGLRAGAPSISEDSKRPERAGRE